MIKYSLGAMLLVWALILVAAEYMEMPQPLQVVQPAPPITEADIGGKILVATTCNAMYDRNASILKGLPGPPDKMTLYTIDADELQSVGTAVLAKALNELVDNAYPVKDWYIASIDSIDDRSTEPEFLSSLTILCEGVLKTAYDEGILVHAEILIMRDEMRDSLDRHSDHLLKYHEKKHDFESVPQIHMPKSEKFIESAFQLPSQDALKEKVIRAVECTVWYDLNSAKMKVSGAFSDDIIDRAEVRAISAGAITVKINAALTDQVNIREVYIDSLTMLQDDTIDHRPMVADCEDMVTSAYDSGFIDREQMVILRDAVKESVKKHGKFIIPEIAPEDRPFVAPPGRRIEA